MDADLAGRGNLTLQPAFDADISVDGE